MTSTEVLEDAAVLKSPCVPRLALSAHTLWG
jgi:hypothetical protein